MIKVGIRPFLLQLFGERRQTWRVLLAFMASWPVAVPPASVAGPTILYSFTAAEFPLNTPETNSDGVAPASRLVLGLDGNLYGTTRHGGANGAGSIFHMTSTGSLTNLYSFPAATNSSGEVVDDLGPNDLALGTNGIFYGTTQRGGSNFNGTIFEISPSGSFTNLHTFAAVTNRASVAATSADGATPVGALAQGRDGNFYGTTQYGGANDTGTIFQITPAGVFSNLYSFSASVAGSITTRAAVPNALVLGNDSAFYGTTQQGGLDNAGTFFEFSSAGGFTQIYSFNGQAPGSNPITPNSALVEDAGGHFYGTSAFGGSQGGGSIFKIAKGGGVILLHSFPQLDAGANATLDLGADGNLYGTSTANGLNGNGTVFRLTPAGEFGAYFFGTLDANLDNIGGANPSAALTADNAGNFYGTCAAGGTNGSGVIFRIFGPDFTPPSFFPVTNPPPALTNVLVGASVALSYLADGIAPLNLQWSRNGTNLIDGGDILGSLTNALSINPVFARDAGSYTFIISNTWGALTSSVTVLTVTPPGVAISSPAPDARTNAPVFAGTAVSAPLFANTNPNEARLTSVIFSLTNIFSGSNITGNATLSSGTGGVSNWSFAVTPFPGTNILSVQSVDVSGNISPAASRSFFYEVPSSLTILTTGSGIGTFTVTNGAMLNLGESYFITAKPVSSVFSNWVGGGVTSYNPTFAFIMQSNLILTANFISRQSPAVFISSPAANTRTSSPVFEGSAASVPLLAGVNSNNIRLVNVAYWLTNRAADFVQTGSATLTQGTGSSNWSVTVTPLPGTNTLAMQSMDVSGDLSPIVSRSFFYEMPSDFALLKAGTGNGTFTGSASVGGDTPPTNGAMLNLGESYTVTAKPDPFSTFSQWIDNAGKSSSQRTMSFIMQPGFALTAFFEANPPVVSIRSPTPNLRTAAPVFNGTASGHFLITNISYSLVDSFTGSVSGGSATLTTGTETVSNWSIGVVPLPGTNTLTVQCQDAVGNSSISLSRTFFYEVPAKLMVTNAGSGGGNFTIKAPGAGGAIFTNGAKLSLAESYTITAVPDKFSLFSNWVSSAGDGFGGNTPALSFVMQSNLVLTVTFVPDFFPAAAGTYNGLFLPTDAVAAETSGMLRNFELMDNGTGSGSLLIDGKRYSIAARFDVSGHTAFSAGQLQVDLTLDSTIPQITGTVSDSQWTANLTADLASNVLPSAEYTILFSPSTNVSDVSPPGDGYALVTNHEGVVTVHGILADGTSFSQTVPVSQAGEIPVYASLYTNAGNPNPGLLLGWINLTNLEVGAPSNALAWIKKPFRSPALYTNGFTNILSIQGSIWTNPPAKTAAISLTNGKLVISNTALLLTFTNIVASNNALTNLGMLPTNPLSGAIDPGTGRLTLTFANGGGDATNTGFGAILQNASSAGGFFLTATNAGAIDLQP